MREPVLRTTIYTKDRERYKLVAHGGLHYIRGNSRPYFTLTGVQERGAPGGRWLEDTCGCIHDLILEHWPELADLAALHLSDDTGVPMHFEGNGWYDLAGALGGAGEQYHVGNSERHFPLPAERRDAAKPWQTTEYRRPTPAECLVIFAEHCRIPVDEARTIAEEVRAQFGPEQESHIAPAWRPSDYARGRAKWRAIAATMTDRFKAEAKACIERHGLVLFGDKWTEAA